MARQGRCVSAGWRALRMWGDDLPITQKALEKTLRFFEQPSELIVAFKSFPFTHIGNFSFDASGCLHGHLVVVLARGQPDFNQVGRRADEEERVVRSVDDFKQSQDHLDEGDSDGDGALPQF